MRFVYPWHAKLMLHLVQFPGTALGHLIYVKHTKKQIPYARRTHLQSGFRAVHRRARDRQVALGRLQDRALTLPRCVRCCHPS